MDEELMEAAQDFVDEHSRDRDEETNKKVPAKKCPRCGSVEFIAVDHIRVVLYNRMRIHEVREWEEEMLMCNGCLVAYRLSDIWDFNDGEW